MKRIIDICGSLVLLIFLVPIILFLALLIKIKLGSPVIFKQQRPGYKENPFYLYKFRSMTDEKDEKGELLPDYRRLTPLGKMLRQLSLDELPQLFNILKGDMSFVGPRPLLMEYLSLYSTEQARRHEVKPGITGWAQVNGRNAITWEEKFKLDVWYVENQSMWLDFKILWLTLVKVWRREGISQQGQATMEKYRGVGS